jgi:hypothetical protein
LWISKIAQDGWMVAFGHDAEFPVGTLHELSGKMEFSAVDLNN